MEAHMESVTGQETAGCQTRSTVGVLATAVRSAWLEQGGEALRTGWRELRRADCGEDHTGPLVPAGTSTPSAGKACEIH